MKIICVAVALCAGMAGIPTVGAAPFKDGDRVVFLGDSITHHGQYMERVSLYYATRFPGRDIWFSGSGESGGRADGALRRLDFDVTEKKPTVVTVMFGMNDVDCKSWPRTGATVTNRESQARAVMAFKRNMTNLVSAICAKAGNPEIIYLTPSPYDQTALIGGRPSDLVSNDGLEILSNWMRDLAKREGRTCVDLQSFLRDLNRREQLRDPGWSFMRPTGDGSFDRVHPRGFGHALIAYAFLKAQGVPAEVSVVSLEASRGLTDECRNVVVSGLEATRTGLEFTALEGALPYPLDADGLLAASFAPIADELDRETFRVVGLEPGLYELSIDGAKVGRWTTQDLSAGINLALNDRTPQYAQAQAVRAIHAEAWKAEVKVRDVRMFALWQKGKAPVEDLAQYGKWYAERYPDGPKDFYGRMASQYLRYAGDADRLWDEANRLKAEARAAAKPVARRWKLVRVGEEERAFCRSVRTVADHAPSLLPAGGEWKLVWNDEFDGEVLDETKWGYRTNFWGRAAHWFARPGDGAVEVKGGCAHLKLVRRPDGQFVSPQLQTGELIWDYPADPDRKDFWPLRKRQPAKFTHTYGYYECRCRLQRKPGWWSAFWMQTETQGCNLNPARSGIEQDIMESFDVGEIVPHCYHMNGYGADYRGFRSTRGYSAKGVGLLPYEVAKVGTDEFHTFGLLWDPDGYTVFIDGRQSGYKVGKGPGEAVSHVPEFVLITTEAKWFRKDLMTGKGVPELEAAVGDAFVVDYVRVYDRK